jgi:hypothetical protein
MYTAACKNLMLDSIGITHLSAHTAYSATGANEVTGGSPAYARKSVTLAAASGGSKAASTQPTFDIPASTTVRWLGYWTAITAGTFLGMVPLGGSEKQYRTDITNDKIQCAAHGLNNDEKVVFYGGSVPGGLTEGTVYFVVNKTTDDFQVAATQGGAAINLTSVNTDPSLFSKIVEEAFGAQGTLQATAATFNLNAAAI